MDEINSEKRIENQFNQNEEVFTVAPKLARNIHIIKLLISFGIVLTLLLGFWRLYIGDLVLSLAFMFVFLLLAINYSLFSQVVKYLWGSIHSITSIKDETASPSKENCDTEISAYQSIDDAFQRLYIDTRKDQQELSIVLCDIDYLSDIKKRYGESVTDMLRERVQQEIEYSIQNSEVVFRWTGEEFIILLPQTSYANAQKFSQALEKRIKNLTFKHDGKHIPISMTTGLSDTQNSTSLYTCIRNADSKMY